MDQGLTLDGARTTLGQRLEAWMRMKAGKLPRSDAGAIPAREFEGISIPS